jgi:hypothetical protein
MRAPVFSVYPRVQEKTMGFLDKAKSAAEQAAAKAKESVDDVQTKRELGQTYSELGKATFDLIQSGDVSHPTLEAIAEKIRVLKADGEPVAAATGGAATEAAGPS